MKEKNQNQKSIKQTNNKTASPGDDVAVCTCELPAAVGTCTRPSLSKITSVQIPAWIGQRPIKSHHWLRTVRILGEGESAFFREWPLVGCSCCSRWPEPMRMWTVLVGFSGLCVTRGHGVVRGTWQGVSGRSVIGLV